MGPSACRGAKDKQTAEKRERSKARQSRVKEAAFKKKSGTDEIKMGSAKKHFSYQGAREVEARETAADV